MSYNQNLYYEVHYETSVSKQRLNYKLTAGLIFETLFLYFIGGSILLPINLPIVISMVNNSNNWLWYLPFALVLNIWIFLNIHFNNALVKIDLLQKTPDIKDIEKTLQKHFNAIKLQKDGNDRVYRYVEDEHFFSVWYPKVITVLSATTAFTSI